MNKGNVVSQGAWSITLTDAESGTGNVILHLSGTQFSELSVLHSYETKKNEF